MKILFSGPIRKSFRAICNLETPRLLLRKILPCDEQDMFEYSKNPETSKYLLWEPHHSVAFTRAHICYLQKQYQNASFFDWALVDKKSGKMIGTCGFTEIYEKRKTAEVGYVLSPAFHRQGLAPEALNKVMEYGFCTLGLNRLLARVMEENLASQKVLTRLGFQLDPAHKESFYKRGKKQMILHYVLEKQDYLQQKKAL